jgi:hypothetical protein
MSRNYCHQLLIIDVLESLSSSMNVSVADSGTGPRVRRHVSHDGGGRHDTAEGEAAVSGTVSYV